MNRRSLPLPRKTSFSPRVHVKRNKNSPEEPRPSSLADDETWIATSTPRPTFTGGSSKHRAAQTCQPTDVCGEQRQEQPEASTQKRNIDVPFFSFGGGRRPFEAGPSSRVPRTFVDSKGGTRSPPPQRGRK